MLNTEQILNKIQSIPEETLVAMVREALTESGVPFEVGCGQIEYYGLSLCFECQATFAMELYVEQNTYAQYYKRGVMLSNRTTYVEVPTNDLVTTSADNIIAKAA